MDVNTLIVDGMDYFGLEQKWPVVDKLSKYVNELFRWQKHINLTGYKEPECVVRNLIYEALFCLKYLQGKKRVMDFGSGSGAISIVFSLFLESHVISVERNIKKVAFQKHVKRIIRLPNLHVIYGSVEEIDPQEADAIFAKGIGKIEKIVKKVDRHLIRSGILLLPKGQRQKPPQIPAYVVENEETYSLPMDEKKKKLLVYKKL